MRVIGSILLLALIHLIHVLVVDVVEGNCPKGYFGTDCTFYQCFGLMSHFATVCSSRGTCIAPNTCSCKSGSFGKLCENEIKWDSSIVAGKYMTKGYTGDGGLAISATLSSPSDVFYRGEEVFIADTFNNVIRKVDKDGIIITVAGTGMGFGIPVDDKATSAYISMPSGVFVTSFGVMYIADSNNHVIRKVEIFPLLLVCLVLVHVLKMVVQQQVQPWQSQRVFM